MMVMTEIIEILEKREKMLLSLENHDVEDDYEILDTCLRQQVLIEEEIYNNPDAYPIDFILEVFTKFDDSPSVVYDGAGNWAISDGIITESNFSSMGIVIDEDGDANIVGAIVDKTAWKPTIREALKHWLKNTQDLILTHNIIPVIQ
jgi:hypothetical protein